MKLKTKTPEQIMRAYIKKGPGRIEIDEFKKNLILLLDKIKLIEDRPTDETEEHLKNDLRDFLRDTFYKDTNAINTKDKKDLVIHLDKATNSEVGVIIEAKRPNNLAEMITADDANKKAMHELILYYLGERKAGNNQLKQLIITNVNEWYIIDANYFDKHIYRNTKIEKDYETKLNDKKDNPWFYEEIEKRLNELDIEIPCVYFNIKNYDRILRNNNKEDDRELNALLKILSPQHLLKIATPNDSNSLDDKFYKELLHIIGLEEVKEGAKDIIRRKKENRNPASLLETTIEAIHTEEVLHRIPDQSIYGTNKEEKTFNVALELCITWINRILFLKLLEGQLIRYHLGNQNFRFLNPETVNDFDELFKLFHKVLAINLPERNDAIKSKYNRVPYLNSSLFEISELEDQTIKINSLDNSGKLELIAGTVLSQFKNKAKSLTTLDYLFHFLDAYNFASDGTSDVQEDNKIIINASVLGKVFEKINGYKDGSIYTPGFITMYMCRNAIRLAVIQKFKDKYGWNIEQFDDLKNYLSDKKSTKDILELNDIINSLRICDPAVGSGHFLVSSLNEIIVIKHELGLLADKTGKRISDFEIEIISDEIIVTGINTGVVEYKIKDGKPITKEIQRLQKTLFHEKQTIIENCLFGVDINPNSVKICRLRLWIELLKNAYYKEDTNFTELETLPNIDINIKCGNSLVSRFALNDDISDALKIIKYDVVTYRNFVDKYKNEKSRETKRQLEDIIRSIKTGFKTEIKDKDTKKLKRYNDALNELLTQGRLFNTAKEKKDIEVQQKKLEANILKSVQDIEEAKANAIYRNAFEWRFEFPEVLSDEGEFVGFDLIVGNPPYIPLQKMQEEQKAFETQNYETYSKLADIYCLFYEKGNQLLKHKGLLAYITSNSWLRAQYGELLRNFFLSKTNPLVLLNLEDKQVFKEAVVESNILLLEKDQWKKHLLAASIKSDFSHSDSLDDYFQLHSMVINELPESGWAISNEQEGDLKTKIKKDSILLGEYGINIFRGFTTGFNEAFFISTEIKNKLITENPECEKIIKPALRGKDISKYNYQWRDIWIILIKQGWTNENKGNENAEIFFKKKYPSVYKFFKETGETIKGKGKGLFKRDDQGDYWWELRSCDYYEEFEKEKIIWGELSDAQKFTLDLNGYYLNNTIFFITGNNLKYLLALLNSKVAKWYFNEIATSSGMGTNRWLKYKIEQLPIKQIEQSDQQPFIDLVDKVILAKQEGKDSKPLEDEIDILVDKLYGITDIERKIIDGK